MAAEPWYVWDGGKDRFVGTERPPRDPQLLEALKSLKIRVADASDRQRLLEFRREAFETEPEIWLPDELDLDEIRGNLERWDPSEYPNDFIIVAELDGKIVGMLLLTLCYKPFDGGPSAWIEDLFVLKGFRGYKVGTRLVEFAKALAMERGCRALRLIVGLDNLAGLSFYRQCGFEIMEIGLAALELKHCPSHARKAER